MKKVVALLLSSVMLLSMAACGKKDEEETKKKKSKKEKETTEVTEEPEDTTESEETEDTTPSDETLDLAYDLVIEDQWNVFKSMVEQYGGLEVCYTKTGFRTVYVGGKDNCYWFLDLQETGDYTLYYDVVNGDEMVSYYFMNEGGTVTFAESSDSALYFICEYVFCGHDRIAYEMVKPSEVTNSDYVCDRFNYDIGAIAYDIARDFGITVRFSNTDDTEAGFDLGSIKTGADVEVLEMPEAGLAEGDIDSIDYWVEKFSTNVCPFYINCNGVETKYYFRNGGEFVEWLRTENNTDGWYFYENNVISADGKWAISNWEDAFSSFCSYEAIPYSGPTLSEEERTVIVPGTLYALHSWTPFDLWGYYYHPYIECGDSTSEEKTFALDNCCCQFTPGSEIRIFMESRSNDEKEFLENHTTVYIMPHADITVYNGVMDDAAKEMVIASGDYIVKSSEDAVDNEEPIFTLTLPETYQDAPLSGDVDVIFAFDDVITYYYVATIG